MYLRRDYKNHKIKNPEIKDYSLIISGKDLPYIKNDERDEEEIKNKILQEIDFKKSEEIDNINFTLKLSDYYEKIENLISLNTENYKITYKINNRKCCFYFCYCSCEVFYCCCKDKNRKKLNNIIEKIETLTNELLKIKNIIKWYILVNHIFIL